MREAFETNLLGAWRMAEACLPLLRESEHARIVNVSSGAGSLADMSSGGAPAYSASKAALNALTRMLAADLRADNVLVNSVCPGGSRPTWAGRAADRSRRAPRASSGRRCSRTTGRPVASSVTVGRSGGDGPPHLSGDR